MIQEVYIEFCGEIAHVMKGLCSISQQEDQPWLDGITCVYLNDIKIRYLDSIWLIYKIGLDSYMPHNFTLVSGFNAMQSCYNILKILTKDTPQLTYECNVWVPFVSSYYYCFTLVNTLLYIIQSSAAIMQSIFHEITYGTVMTVAEPRSDFILTTDTPYLTLTGELWNVCWKDIREHWLR